MKLQRLKTVFVIAVLCALAGALMHASLFAKPKPKDAPRDKLQNRIEQMVVWELSDVMNLPQDKEDRFIDVMRRHFKDKRDLTEKQFQIMDNLQRQYNNNNASDSQLLNAVNDLENNFDKQISLQKNLHGELKRFLSARELARFAIEWPRVQERVRGKIEKKRGNNKPNNR